MLATEFLKDPSKVSPNGIFVLYGDDLYLRRESRNELRRLALPEGDDLAATTFSGDSASLADVLDELRTLPFFSKQRFVVVEGGDPFVTAHRKELETAVQSLPSSGTLVIEVKAWPSNTNLAKLVEKRGVSIDCKGPKESTLIPWITQFVKTRYQTQLDADATMLLLELVGPEIGLLTAELEKLSIYVGAKGKIQRDDVAKMVGAGRIETVWKVIEAATTGKSSLAMEQLDALLNSGESPVGLLNAMASSLLKVHRAGRLRRLRMDLKDACAAAGVNSWSVEMVKQQHSHLGPLRVDRLPATLLKADLDLKGSSPLPPRFILERLIVELSTPRRD